MCLGVFCALVYVRHLEWYYAAEVTVIILTELIVGIVALCGTTYKVAMGIPVAILYGTSMRNATTEVDGQFLTFSSVVMIVIVAILDGPLVGWK